MQKRHMIIAGGLAGILVLGGIGVQYAGSKAVEIVHKMAEQQTVLKGKLVFSDVQANFSGDVVFENLVWTDPAGVKVASVPKLNISVNLSDAFKGNFGTGSIKDVIIERPEFSVAYSDKNGLNIINLINFSDEKDDTPTAFRGIIEIKDALVNLAMNGQKINFSKVQMQANLQQFPTMKFNLQGKDGEADLIGNIVKTGEDVTFQAEVKKFQIPELMKLLPSFGELNIAKGVIQSSKLVAAYQGKWTVTLDGNLTGVDGNALGYNFTNGSGKFQIDNQAATFSDVKTNLEAQPITLQGKINFHKESMPTYDLDLATPAFRIDAISPGLGIAEAIAATGKVTGTIDNPLIKGAFSMAKLELAPLYMSDIQGQYTYQGGLVQVHDSSANVYAGTIGVNGMVNAANKAFNLNIVGSGLDSTAVTETQIHGALGFDLDTQGTGDVDSATATGSFNISDGDFAGIPFNGIAGNINRANGIMSFSNIKVATDAGTFGTNATVTSTGKVKFGKLDGAFTYSTKEEIKEEIRENVKTKVDDAVKKGLGKFFGK
ncbi:MAG: hypothetical protein RSD70_02235 [Acidaminococcaceae bacterium]